MVQIAEFGALTVVWSHRAKSTVAARPRWYAACMQRTLPESVERRENTDSRLEATETNQDNASAHPRREARSRNGCGWTPL